MFENYYALNSAWIGKTAVHSTDVIDLSKLVNFRAPSSMHRSYELVWVYERELFSYGLSWPLIIDEAIRFLGQEGKLIVRTRDSENGTLFELKSALFRNPSLVVQLVEQHRLPDNDITSVFSIRRNNLSAYKDNGWTIGILSDGRKADNVRALAERLIFLAKGRPLQVVIAGTDELELPSQVTGPTEPWQDLHKDNLPRIGEKKNWIVQQASHDNIAIFHDRYQVDDNFFSGFEEFGLDFDYVAIAQRYEGGAYFPADAGFLERKFRWQKPHFDPSHSTVLDGHFVNGGIIIVKRHLAIAINFNPLLLHQEAEDVEFAFALRASGIVPRFNAFSSAETIGLSTDYTKVFIDVTKIRFSDLAVTPKRKTLHKIIRKKIHFMRDIGRRIRRKIRSY